MPVIVLVEFCSWHPVSGWKEQISTVSGFILTPEHRLREPGCLLDCDDTASHKFASPFSWDCFIHGNPLRALSTFHPIPRMSLALKKQKLVALLLSGSSLHTCVVTHSSVHREDPLASQWQPGLVTAGGSIPVLPCGVRVGKQWNFYQFLHLTILTEV
jgi:hypothetical protein